MQSVAIQDTFEKVICINLRRREERWRAFLSRLEAFNWPFRPISRVEAIDGNRAPPPDWWKRDASGVWGCYRSHLRVLEDALNEGIGSLLVLEDDAAFVNDFTVKITRFLQCVPADWDQIYLGGRAWGRIEVINEEVDRVYGVLNTHAYAIQGRFIEKLYGVLCSLSGNSLFPVDVQMCLAHFNSTFRIYKPREWLVIQEPSTSDVQSTFVD